MAETGKSFVKKFVGFSVVTWISFIISFLSAPISTRLFDPSVLGKINIFNTYTNLWGILILVGLDQAYARFYYERPNNRTIGYPSPSDMSSSSISMKQYKKHSKKIATTANCLSPETSLETKNL